MVNFQGEHKALRVVLSSNSTQSFVPFRRRRFPLWPCGKISPVISLGVVEIPNLQIYYLPSIISPSF